MSLYKLFFLGLS